MSGLTRTDRDSEGVRPMSNELYLRMKEFFETNPITKKLVEPLKEGAVAWMEFEGDETPYTLIKEKGKSVLRPGKPEKPELYMKFNKGAIDYLFELRSDNIQDYALRLFECAIRPTPERRVEGKLLTSLLDAYRKGYIKMLLLGGPKAVGWAAQLGISIPKKFLR